MHHDAGEIIGDSLVNGLFYTYKIKNDKHMYKYGRDYI